MSAPAMCTPSDCGPTATRNPEARMVERLQAGDAAAYEDLFREYAGRLTGAARRLLHCEDECADAVQDTFVSAFKGIAAFEGGSRLGTWLHRILVNHCLMRLRRRKRAGLVSLDAASRAVNAAGRPGGDQRPDDRMTRQEMVLRVRNELDRLPPAYREIVLLRDFDGLDTGAVADRLGTSRAVVKTRLHRARAALRSALGEGAD